MRLSIRQNIPNAITLLNLFLGCVAIVCAFNGLLTYVPIIVFIAGLADFADGLAARVLKVHSPLGGQLDSLADMVTFGVVPGIAMFQLLALSFDPNPNLMDPRPDSAPHLWYLAPAFLITIFSAIRLAKFNVDERQTKGFLGLATPASTALVLGMVAGLYSDRLGPIDNRMDELILQPSLLYGVTILISILLVAEIPMFSLKFKGAGFRGNELRYFIIFFGISLIMWLGLASGMIIIPVYMFLSLANNWVNSLRHQTAY